MKFQILILLGLVSVGYAGGEPLKRFEMWDHRYVPTSNFQLCRELEDILNHPINADRETRLPGQMFKIPEGYPHFKEIKWEVLPEEEWDDYIDDTYRNSRYFQEYRLLAKEKLGKEIVEKAFYNADHYGDKEWVFRVPYYRPNSVVGIQWGGGKAVFEKNTAGVASPAYPPFYFKGRVFNFTSNGSERGTGDLSVQEPNVGIKANDEPYFAFREVCTFNDNQKEEK